MGHAEYLDQKTDTLEFSREDRECLSLLLTRLSSTHDDPIEGLAGYLVTEDPTYLSDDADVKLLARSIGRDKLLRMILSLVIKSGPDQEEV
ncbi:MAG: IreB family regulatory phosphoprotein [Clostridia bacterium]|nr:IreB family regulatory phosphoprotein [Clostridia bacterium]